MAKARTPRFMRLTDAIKRIGPHICPDWDGTERTAPARSELFRDLGAVLVLSRKQLLREDARHRKSIEEEAERQRAGGAHQSGIPEAITKLRELIAKPETPEPQRAAMRKTLALLTAPPPEPDRNTRRIADRRVERTKHRLADELFAAYKPAETARFRWASAHATLRDKVFTGELRAFARLPDGEPMCPTITEWRDCFPPPDKSRVYLPSFGGKIPATVLFDRVELDRIFPPGSSQREQPGRPSEDAAEVPEPKASRTRLAYRSELEEFMQRDSQQLGNLTDRAIAQRFRENSKRTDLPPKSRDLEKQVKAIRARTRVEDDKPGSGKLH